jgi:hypothetical protein
VLREADSFLSIRSDSKLAMRCKRGAAANMPLTAEERDYAQRNGRLEKLIRRLDQLLRPVLTVMQLPPVGDMEDNLLPRDIHNCRAKMSTAEFHARRLPNRVQQVLDKVRRLERQLFTLRRDFALDECYCAWADTAAPTARVQHHERDSQKENVYLELILKQFAPPSGSGPDAEEPQQQQQQQQTQHQHHRPHAEGSTARHGGSDKGGAQWQGQGRRQAGVGGATAGDDDEDGARPQAHTVHLVVPLKRVSCWCCDARHSVQVLGVGVGVHLGFGVVDEVLVTVAPTVGVVAVVMDGSLSAVGSGSNSALHVRCVLAGVLCALVPSTGRALRESVRPHASPGAS